MAGVAERVIMKLLGHRDPRMTVRYQRLAPGHLQDAMRALDSIAAGTSPTSDMRAAAQPDRHYLRTEPKNEEREAG